MARKLKSEILAAEEAARQRQQEQEAAAYPQAFLSTVALALRENFELLKVDETAGVFLFVDRDDRDQCPFEVSQFYDPATAWKLDVLNAAAIDKITEREAARQRDRARLQGLAKLTLEEREALGL